MAAVTIRKSPQGSVVIVKGFGYVTASALMPLPKARVLAARIEYERARNAAAKRDGRIER